MSEACTAPATRVLLVTNDFPPTAGGIQSYLRDFTSELVARGVELEVFASTQDAQEARAYDAQLPYAVHRWPRRVMLPTPATARQLRRLVARRRIDVVWFGAAAPLALMASAAREAGARRVVASTHGHEVGWSMLPGARRALRSIGNGCDAVTYISAYTLRRLRSALGPHPELHHLPSGVSTDVFAPADPPGRFATRERLGLEPRHRLVVCASRLVTRKGQDSLIRAWPAVVRSCPDAELLIVGEGPAGPALHRLAAASPARHRIHFAGRLTDAALAATVAAADVFAMPARTRGGGLDVEGLGIVYLEAQSAGVPVIAGESGGAPETVCPGAGVVVNGKDMEALAAEVTGLLSDLPRARAMGAAGREGVEKQWTWESLGDRCRDVLLGS